MSSVRLLLLATLLALPAGEVLAQGHGPAFGLSTPTLGKRAWSLDLGLMSRSAGASRSVMMRPMVSYGMTEDVQLSVNLPVPVHVDASLPQARAMTRMPMSPDVEIVLGWRFQRNDARIGTRLETTAYGGLTYPTVSRRSGIGTSPGVWAGLVTGLASRSWYVWVGGLHRRYLPSTGGPDDRQGAVTMYSAVIGFRPPAFREDYPSPDWRVFVEMVGEVVGRDRLDGIVQANTGGHRIFVGPTVLGIYGSWAVSGGPLFPVHLGINGNQPGEGVRVIVNTSFWFF